MATAFNPEKELVEIGRNYKTYGTYCGYPYSEISVLESPLTPRENWIRYFKGEDYEWIPNCAADVYEVAPDLIPDIVASGYEGGKDNFGVTWKALENGLPAMVQPGNPVLKDIEDWRDVLVFPDVDSWDWEGAAEKYKESVNEGRFVRGIILSGYFERLISLMDFENAAMAMITDPDEVRELFEKLADMNISIIEHYKKYFNVDGVLVHDDWAAQLAPFFSLETTREVVMPPYKRMVDRAHELGLLFSAHCCGNAYDRIPVMLECGVDSWQMQYNACDVAKSAIAGQGKLKLEPMLDNMPAGMNEEETEAYILEVMRGYVHDGRLDVMLDFVDPVTYGLSPELRKIVYRVGRILANELSK